jgi:hypothetical protein
MTSECTWEDDNTCAGCLLQSDFQGLNLHPIVALKEIISRDGYFFKIKAFLRLFFISCLIKPDHNR